jgi:hypothetical protein
MSSRGRGSAGGSDVAQPAMPDAAAGEAMITNRLYMIESTGGTIACSQQHLATL